MSEDIDDVPPPRDKNDHQSVNKNPGVPYISTTISSDADESISKDEFSHWKDKIESEKLGGIISANEGDSRRRSSQLSSEFGHDGYGYTNPMPQQSALAIAGLRAERRAEVERRCIELDPPLTKDILTSMITYRTTIQDICPLTDLGWKSLKQNLLAERANAESQPDNLANQPPKDSIIGELGNEAASAHRSSGDNWVRSEGIRKQRSHIPWHNYRHTSFPNHRR